LGGARRAGCARYAQEQEQAAIRCPACGTTHIVTERQAILLVAGDKAGVAQKRFYKMLIAKADQRFADHLAKLKGK
jgi:DNA-directed RNA polymerase subunit RPC12/RpoP